MVPLGIGAAAATRVGNAIGRRMQQFDVDAEIAAKADVDAWGRSDKIAYLAW